MKSESRNRLWASSELHLEPAFLQIAQTDFHGGLGGENFSHPIVAVHHINGWVKDRTGGLIPDLLKPTDLTPDTLLVLTDALYFKGAWQAPFEAQFTQEEPFYLASGARAAAPMMRQIGHFAYSRSSGVQALRLPYRGGEASMVILLPKRGASLAQLGSRLTAGSFQALLASLQERDVNLRLPRFTSNQRLPLMDDLQALGIKRAFNSVRAQFDGISWNKAGYISKVVHQSFVQVNEAVTKAAAATAVMESKIVAAPNPERPIDFIADHAFLYFIMDDTNGAILFAGAVQQPQ